MLYPGYKHSHASGNAYRASPSLFIWKWGLKNWSDEKNARQAMGAAIHYGVQQALLEGLEDQDAIDLAKQNFDELMLGEVTKERECIDSITLRFMQRLRPLGRPTSAEEETVVDGAVYGLKYPVKVVTDLRYQELCMELKATLRCPSAMGDFQYGHGLQAAVYTMICGIPFTLLYASTANSFLSVPSDEEIEAGWEEMLASWRRIEALDAVCETPADAMDLIPFAAEQFWDPGERRQARKAWSMVRALGEGDLTILDAG